MTPMRYRFAILSAVLVLLVGLLSVALVPAETCLSPFVKRMERPEKYLYVFCVDADAKDNDFLAVIDVDAKSPTYGEILHQLDLGSAGNETHHFGFTDDRTHIWGCSLFSNRLFVIDVASDPARPKLVKSFDSAEKTGLTGPHSPYALPGRMLISFLGGKDGGMPAGLAEFTNDGTFIRKFELPKDAPYGYDVAINPDLNRMVTSSFTPPETIANRWRRWISNTSATNCWSGTSALAKCCRRSRPAAAPLECRWSLAKDANHGYCNCAWRIPSGSGKAMPRTATRRASCATPANCRPISASRRTAVSVRQLLRLRRSAAMGRERSEKAETLVSTVKPGVQPNMLHLTGDGKRMYVTNSLLSTMDRSDDFWVRLIRVGPDGMKMDPKFKVDLTKFKTGPARGHDMLLY